MKGVFIGLIVLFATQLKAQTSLTQLQWLIGDWTRTNAKPGRSGLEIWRKISETEFIGKGITLKGADTTFVEELKIIINENRIFYVADVPENKEAVLFEATSLSSNAITFENPKHDFPKKIIYERTGSKLRATISGDGNVIDYWFEKDN